MCYENPKNKITAVPANEEDFWGATFKVTIWEHKSNNVNKIIIKFSLGNN
jgi:hypothetical protein